MTKGGRKAGGILAIIGGGIAAFFLVSSLIVYINYPDELNALGTLIIMVFWTAFGIIGGILLYKDVTVGAFFPILSGINFLLYFFVDFQLPIGTDPLIPEDPLIGILVLIISMALLLTIGGILGGIFGSEKGE